MKIACIPLDNRPCTMLFPRALASMLDFSLLMPPVESLGDYVIPGEPARLAQWLEELPGDMDAAIISIDMMIFGGLVASRSSYLNDEEVQQNLLRFQGWLKKTRIKEIHAFSVIMRNMPTFTSPEIQKEAPRFQKMLRELYEISRKAPHRLLSSIEKAKLTGAISPDYFDTRQRNHRVNLMALQWQKENLLDYLMIGLDDVVTRGLNIYEKQVLEKIIRDEAIEGVHLYPGTDEMILMLIARLACRHFHRKPLFAIHYSSQKGRDTTPLYEDRSVAELIQSYIACMGGQIIDEAKRADIQLFVHLFPGGQMEAGWQKIRKTARWSVLPFIQGIRKALQEDRLVAIADIAFANGADIAFSEAMLERIKLNRLAAYAAWNTAGNTMGTVIAQSTLRWLSLEFRRNLEDYAAAEKAHQVFLLSRLIDDWIFQSAVREKIRQLLEKEQISPFNLGDGKKRVEHLVDRMVVARGEEIFRKGFAGSYFLPSLSSIPARITIEGPFACQIHLPWARLFEIDVDCDFTLRHTPLEEK